MGGNPSAAAATPSAESLLIPQIPQQVAEGQAEEGAEVSRGQAEGQAAEEEPQSAPRATDALPLVPIASMAAIS